MTPLGHASVSYLVSKTSRRLVPAVVVVGGVLPDIDFLLLPIPSFNSFHRVATHNLFFLALCALALVSFVRRDRGAVVVSFLVGALLHLFCDSIIDTNPSNGIGVALLWPLSDAMLSPFNIPTPVEGGIGWRDIGEMMGRVKLVLPYEIAFWVAGLVLFVRSRVTKVSTDGAGSPGATG